MMKYEARTSYTIATMPFLVHGYSVKLHFHILKSTPEGSFTILCGSDRRESSITEVKPKASTESPRMSFQSCHNRGRN